MGLTSDSYLRFRTFLREEGCEEAFDRAFCDHNHSTVLDARLWEAGEAEFIIGHAFDWATTPEGREYWLDLDARWQREMMQNPRLRTNEGRGWGI